MCIICFMERCVKSLMQQESCLFSTFLDARIIYALTFCQAVDTSMKPLSFSPVFYSNT